MPQVLCVIVAHLWCVACDGAREATVEGGGAATEHALEVTPELLVGAWCGGRERGARCEGDEALYLELSRGAGGGLEGELCESPGQDCFGLSEVRLEEAVLSLRYGFEDRPGLEVEVRGTFTYEPWREELRGELWSSKCSCSVERTLWRLSSPDG